MLRLSDADQRFFVQRTLSSSRLVVHAPRYFCFKKLLKLNQFVNSMDQQSAEYRALHTLRAELISTLNAYYENPKQANAFSTLQTKWQAATAEAGKTMNQYSDWKTFLANLVLSLISIPLLGLPLAVNYYRTNGKHAFFQTSELGIVEKLGETDSQYFACLER